MPISHEISEICWSFSHIVHYHHFVVFFCFQIYLYLIIFHNKQLIFNLSCSIYFFCIHYIWSIPSLMYLWSFTLLHTIPTILNWRCHCFPNFSMLDHWVTFNSSLFLILQYEDFLCWGLNSAFIFYCTLWSLLQQVWRVFGGALFLFTSYPASNSFYWIPPWPEQIFWHLFY